MNNDKLELYGLYVESFGRTRSGGKTDSDHFRGPWMQGVPGSRFNREQTVAVTLGVCHAQAACELPKTPEGFERALNATLGKPEEDATDKG